MQTHTHSTSNQKPSWRNLRNYINFGMPLVGTQIIVTVLLFTRSLPTVAYIVLGIIMIEVGIWKLAPKLLPDNRKYHALRAQTSQFINLVRQLNAAALKAKENNTPENRQAVEDVHQSMQQLVHRIVDVAGKTDHELVTVPSNDKLHDVTDVIGPHERSNHNDVKVNV